MPAVRLLPLASLVEVQKVFQTLVSQDVQRKLSVMRLVDATALQLERGEGVMTGSSGGIRS